MGCCIGYLPYSIGSYIAECFIIAALVMWWAVYVKFVSTESKLEETILFLKFFFDMYSGLHTIAKYDMKISFLEEVPLQKILIFKQNFTSTETTIKNRVFFRERADLG